MKSYSPNSKRHTSHITQRQDIGYTQVNGWQKQIGIAAEAIHVFCIGIRKAKAKEV